MSTSYAIAGVTAVLEYLLNNGDQFGVPHVVDRGGAVVTTIAKAPDQIVLSDSMTANLNLFLHQISPNAAWRNRELPSHNTAGDRTVNQTLGLDLHYFVTAYGGADLEAEALLGYAVQVFHEVPVLSRQIIRSALSSLSLGGNYEDILRGAGLADQIEQLKISPFPLSTEEMSRFWTAMQAHYRPTFSFQVTVVLMKALTPSVSPLPVLTVNIGSQTGLVPSAPQITAIVPPADPNAIQIIDTVTVQGTGLVPSPVPNVILSNDKFGISLSVQASGTPTPTQAQFTLAGLSDADRPPAGSYLVKLQLDPGAPQEALTNGLPVLIAPRVTNFPITASVSGGEAVIQVSCDPPVHPDQSVSLIVGGTEIPADPIAGGAPVKDLSFTVKVPDTLAAGAYFALLRVDGIDSFIVDRTADPPVYLSTNTITVS